MVHSAIRVLGLPLPLGVLSAAQLGVPIAAVTVGTQLGVMGDGEPAAILLAAMITIGAANTGWCCRVESRSHEACLTAALSTVSKLSSECSA